MTCAYAAVLLLPDDFHNLGRSRYAIQNNGFADARNRGPVAVVPQAFPGNEKLNRDHGGIPFWWVVG